MSGMLYSHDAEASLIGSVFLDNALLADLDEIVRPEDFYITDHRSVWSAIVNLARKGSACDVVTVSEHLDATGQLDHLGGLAALAEMARYTPSAANAKHYARIVADFAQRRAMLERIIDIEEELRNREIALPDVLTKAKGGLDACLRSGQGDSLAPISSKITSVIDTLDRRFNGEEDTMGRTTGLADLDERIMGLTPGLHVLGARPSMGKTAALLHMTAADLKTPSLIVSAEMPEERLIERLMACVGNMPLQAIKNPQKMMDEHWPSLTLAVNLLKDAPLYIDDRSGQTVTHIRRQALEIANRHGGIGFIGVDYIQKLRCEKDHGMRNDLAIGEIAEGLSELGKELKCPVLALSQLNRALEQRPNKRPIMSDLKESSVIEQEAETITFLYRDEVYNPDNPDNKGLAEFISAKVRDGEIGTTHTLARLSHARFENLTTSTLQEY